MAKKKAAKKRQQVANRDYIISYFIKEPTETRRSFSIVMRKQFPDGKREHSTVKLQIIKDINKELKSEKISPSVAKMRINEIKDGLYKTEKKLRGVLELDSKNEEAYHTYLDKHYSKLKRQNLKDFKAAENEIMRAFRALGNVSIRTASRDEIENQIVEHCGDNIMKQRKIASRLNSVLKSIGRNDIKLTVLKRPHHDVIFITETELGELIDHIETNVAKDRTFGNLTRDQFIILIKALFYSGLRIGEAKAADIKNWRPADRVYRVTHQIDDNGKKRLPKGDKTRRIVIHKRGEKAFSQWLKFEGKSKINRNLLTKNLKSFCEKLFQKDETKHLTLHSMRHCMAVFYLRDCSFSLSAVASLLGDSIHVTEIYYANFVLHDETLEMMSQKTAG